VAVTVEKVEEIPAIMSYGVMSTPGVVLDGTVATPAACRAATGWSNG
jgi:hypothetical protein